QEVLVPGTPWGEHFDAVLVGELADGRTRQLPPPPGRGIGPGHDGDDLVPGRIEQRTQRRHSRRGCPREHKPHRHPGKVCGGNITSSLERTGRRLPRVTPTPADRAGSAPARWLSEHPAPHVRHAPIPPEPCRPPSAHAATRVPVPRGPPRRPHPTEPDRAPRPTPGGRSRPATSRPPPGSLPHWPSVREGGTRALRARPVPTPHASRGPTA